MHPFNFPGPFYTGVIDTVGAGVPEAPANVLFDGDCCEYVFRQPRDYDELIQVTNTAVVECYSGYACDGNEHWTAQACREWWRKRGDHAPAAPRPTIPEREQRRRTALCGLSEWDGLA